MGFQWWCPSVTKKFNLFKNHVINEIGLISFLDSSTSIDRNTLPADMRVKIDQAVEAILIPNSKVTKLKSRE